MDFGVIAGIIVVGVVLWFLHRSQTTPVFVVVVQNGVALTRHGTVTDAFLNEVTEQCLSVGVVSGELRGVPRGPRISLSFSKEFPADLQQRLRNWWGLHGWLATPRRRT